MAGIAGIARPAARELVGKMLQRMAHRGPAGREVVEVEGATLGVVWPGYQAQVRALLVERGIARDGYDEGHLAQAQVQTGTLMLKRDHLGLAPLYVGTTDDGVPCFASEVKALLEVTRDVREFAPGHLGDGRQEQPYYRLEKAEPFDEPPEAIASELHRRLAGAVKKRIATDVMGAWLSGGLDSSAMTALARPHVRRMHTFAVGLAGAPDLKHAREVAQFLGTQHHELVVDVARLLAVLPEVIYHLESFDALLVRSSLNNYLVAGLAAEHVPAVFSGEGGDELFAGYEYLKALPPGDLPSELIDMAGRLHNTAFQRVDRSASAHGLVAHVPFADPEVVEYALRIPVAMKLRTGVEKWILRRALDGRLPDSVLTRTKSKFWEGSGLGDLLSRHADHSVTGEDFARQRNLPNGWVLNTKEELVYYRVFRERFGDLASLEWMGRTKGAPKA